MSAIGVVMPVHFRDSLRIPEVHCTLIYLGEHGKVQISRPPLELAVDRLRSQCSPMMIKVKGVEVFGNGHNTVLTLDDRALKSYRQFLDRELARDGIRSASQYAYNPHVTLTKHPPSKTPHLPWDDFRTPEYVWIDRPVIWWKDFGTSSDV